MMELLSWKKEYSMGIPKIDEQHKELINLINILSNAYNQKRETPALDYATQKLLEYTLFHFATEELFFQTYQYDEAEEHKKEHAFFIKKISRFKKDFDESKVNLTQEMIAFLNGWITHHIMNVDQKYREFFDKAGIRPE